MKLPLILKKNTEHVAIWDPYASVYDGSQQRRLLRKTLHCREGLFTRSGGGT